MKTFVLALFQCIVFISFSQDVIETRAGIKISCKVFEITENTVRYYREDQPNGPIRSISTREILVITYADGNKERFIDAPPTEAPQEITSRPEPKYPPRRGLDRIPLDKDRILESGLFWDISLGGRIAYGDMRSFGFSPRVGSKWYFGENERYRFGLQAVWLRIGLYFDDLPYYGDFAAVYVAPAGLGFSHAFKFKEDIGLEFNMNAAPIFMDESMPEPQGFMLAGDIKFRKKRFACGLDYSYIKEAYYFDYHVVGLCAGLKF